MDGETSPLEVAVSEFFKKFRVGIYGRDNVRKSICEETGGELDIGDPKVFERLAGMFTRNETPEKQSLVRFTRL